MSIQLGGTSLSYRLSDGTSVFDGLDFDLSSGHTGLTGRNGAGKTTLLYLLAGLLKPTGGSVTVTGKVVLLEQDAHGLTYASIAHALGIEAAAAAFARVLKGTGIPDDLDFLDGRWDLFDRAETVLAAMGLPPMAMDRPYRTLSGGEQTRLRFARLLLERPDVVLLDEPTNHLDGAGRRFVYDWIDAWNGPLVVACHDRELLERMNQTAVLDAHGLHLFGGPYSFYKEQEAITRTASERVLADARKELRKSRQVFQKVREQQEHRQKSGKKAGKKAGLGKMAAGIKERAAQNTAARLSDVHQRKIEEQTSTVAQARQALIVDRSIAVDLSFTAVPSRRQMVVLRDVNMHFPGTPGPLWPHPVSMLVAGPERIAIEGLNGSGKSTLLHLIDGTLAPTVGSRKVGATRIALLDQQVAGLSPQLSVLENARRTAPARPDHEIRLLLARFLFGPDDLVKPASVLSGGERMRAGLACLLLQDQAPDLLLLDEPTNNLDISSVDEITGVLTAYRGALIVVSHDEAFLRAIGITRRIPVGLQDSPTTVLEDEANGAAVP